jgi:glycosyltransferase involved in cell wall biosynthesis
VVIKIGCGIMKKLKVVWICHFSNKDIREQLPLSKFRIKNSIKSILGMQHDHYFDFAPWITNQIKEFEKRNDIDLHIIAPFLGLTHFTYELEMDKVNYHFYQPGIPIIHLAYDRFNIWGKPSYLLNRYYVKRFINKIKPDIVNLIGTENPYYSITALDIKNIPVYVSVQTVYSNPDRKKYSDSCEQLKWDVELMLHKKEKYYGCTGRLHRDLILKNNPEAIIFKMHSLIQRPAQVKALPKIYDFVFFSAGVTKKKGIEDAIDALAIVKVQKKNVRMNVVGGATDDYKTYLLNKISELNLKENIIFNDYFPLHSDMYEHIVQSHFAVLPVKLDLIPGSVIEAIMLELPVITYKTSGMPYLNKDGESVLISEIGDIEMLAGNMLKIMESPNLAKRLIKNAKAYVDKECNNTANTSRLIGNYRAVIEHFKNNSPIPEDQLFDINEFPIY